MFRKPRKKCEICEDGEVVLLVAVRGKREIGAEMYCLALCYSISVGSHKAMCFSVHLLLPYVLQIIIPEIS